MRRRELLGALAGAAAWPAVARSQPISRKVKVGILTSGNQLGSPPIEAFRREMQKLGYVESENLNIEFRTAPGEPDRLETFAVELVRLPVDVIVTDGTPSAFAAKRATTEIPI